MSPIPTCQPGRAPTSRSSATAPRRCSAKSIPSRQPGRGRAGDAAAGPAARRASLAVDEQTRPPVKTAVALQYERGKAPAPKIASTGKGAIAERIVAIAREHNVPVREDPDLVQ